MDEASIERESMEFDVVVVGAGPSADQRRRAMARAPEGACSGIDVPSQSGTAQGLGLVVIVGERASENMGWGASAIISDELAHRSGAASGVYRWRR